MMKSNNTFFSSLARDIPASIVVFLVALPLCLGIASGSGAPYFSGIIAGVVGGIIVGVISGSHLSVSGPAAGLITIVSGAITGLPSYEAFTCAVVVAGFLQLLLGKLKAGVLADFVPSSVIKGMLAAIGLLLIMKEFPHLLGDDTDFEGDETFIQPDGENTFTEILKALKIFSPAAFFIGSIAVAFQFFWDTKFIKQNKFLSLIPGALVVVVVGIVVNVLLVQSGSQYALNNEHLVQIPIANSFSEFRSFFTFPDFSQLHNSMVITTAFTIAIVASLESLLSLEAVDRLDPYKRVSPTNRELIAQGAGNVFSGLLGGLPVTAVIVRSSANVTAGAQTKLSAILHGVLLLVCVYFISTYLNMIPRAALAGVLLFVGYKLVKFSIFKEMYQKGIDQFIPFLVTIVVILFTDLLVGILVGVLVGLSFVTYSNFKRAVLLVKDENQYLLRFSTDVSFLNKSYVKSKLEEIEDGSYVLIDGTKSNFIDKDVVEVVNDFAKHASLKSIRVEFKKSQSGKNYFTDITPENYE